MKVETILFLLIVLVLSNNSYEVLGLKRGASLEDVKRAFRKLSIQYHPDKTNDPEDVKKFVEISNAYQYIVEGKVEEELT
jgi:DnaJ-class molecular chaperone